MHPCYQWQKSLSQVLWDMSNAVSRYKAIHCPGNLSAFAFASASASAHCMVPHGIICVDHVHLQVTPGHPPVVKLMRGSHHEAEETFRLLYEESALNHSITPSLYYFAQSFQSLSHPHERFDYITPLWVPTDDLLKQGKRWKGGSSVREAWIAAVVRYSTRTVFTSVM